MPFWQKRKNKFNDAAKEKQGQVPLVNLHPILKEIVESKSYLPQKDSSAGRGITLTLQINGVTREVFVSHEQINDSFRKACGQVKAKYRL